MKTKGNLITPQSSGQLETMGVLLGTNRTNSSAQTLQVWGNLAAFTVRWSSLNRPALGIPLESQGCPTFRHLWATLEEELSQATH